MGATPSLNTLPMHTKLPNYLGRSWPMSQTNLLHLNIQHKHWSIFHNIRRNPQHFLLKFSLHNFQLCILVGPSVQLWIQTQSTTATANYHTLVIATIRFIYMIASLKNTCSTLNGDNIFYMQSTNYEYWSKNCDVLQPTRYKGVVLEWELLIQKRCIT